jgi:hypothetical protein
MIPWNKGKGLSKEHKEKLKESNIETWKAVELKEKMSKIKKKHWDKKSKEKLSKTIKDFWKNNPKKLASMKRKIKLNYSKTNLEQEISKKLKEMYRNHPHLKERNRRIALLYYATHEKERKTLLNYKNTKKIKTKLGYVKSSYEKRVADFLSIKEIREEVNPIPDFYLRKLNILVEVYGLKPGTISRKRLKEKYYKKYNIPVIGLTPAEIRDLDKNLLKEARKLSKTKQAKNFNIKKFTKPRKEWIKELENG